jgi:putative membrane protein
MFVWIAKWVINAIALYIVSQIVGGITISGFTAAMIAVVVISLVNMVLKPILFLLTLPVTILTLGLFSLVINAVLFLIAGSLVPGFTVSGFGPAFLGSLVYSVISMLLNLLVR